MDERSDKKRFLKAGQETRTVIKVGADFYVLASSLELAAAHQSLANGESFAVFEVGGDFLESPLEALGFFHQRYALSKPLRTQDCGRDSILS